MAVANRIDAVIRLARCGAAPHQAQRGQALAETLVACIVMVPFVLLIVLLGKFQSVQQATIAGSRTLAFECTVRIEACQNSDPVLLEELRQRHFASPSLPLQTEARVTDAGSPTQRHPLWTDRRNRSLLERYEDVEGQLTQHDLDGGIEFGWQQAPSAAVGRLRALLSDPPAQFGLQTRAGLVEAQVQANLSASNGATSFLNQLDNLRISPRAKTAIFSDAWNASGPYGRDDRHSVEARAYQGAGLGEVTEFMITGGYALTIGMIFAASLLFLESRGFEFNYHEFDVDIVPTDRVRQ